MSRKVGTGYQFQPPKEVHDIIVKLYCEYEWGPHRIVKELELDILPITLGRYLKRSGVLMRTYDKCAPQPCIACNEPFNRNSWKRELCFTCAPDRSWSARYYNYGITKPQFDNQLDLQNYLCDLCGKPLPEDFTEMRIDHCHEQGHMRGILHNKCNIGLHYIEDSEFVGLAVKYVEKWKR